MKSQHTVSLRVLVVDRNFNFAIDLSELLRGRGHTVVSATTGETALVLARVLEPDVVVLDTGMPDMDAGLLALRLHATFPQLRLITFGEHGLNILARAELRLCETYVMLPTDRKVLAALVDAEAERRD